MSLSKTEFLVETERNSGWYVVPCSSGHEIVSSPKDAAFPKQKAEKILKKSKEIWKKSRMIPYTPLKHLL